MNHLFITGTDTNIGKTYASSLLFLSLLKDNKKPCYFKPIQTGCTQLNKNISIPDIDFIKKNIKPYDSNDFKCSYPLEFEVSPHLSSKLTNKRISIDKIIADFNNIKEQYNYTIVEGAGGVFAPINTENYFMINLIKDLNLKTIIVTNTKVGTINHSILTINSLKFLNISIGGIIFNKFEDNHVERDNINFIKDYSSVKNILILNKENDIEIFNKDLSNVRSFINNI